jgi:hypothetical protein
MVDIYAKIERIVIESYWTKILDIIHVQDRYAAALSFVSIRFSFITNQDTNCMFDTDIINIITSNDEDSKLTNGVWQ